MADSIISNTTIQHAIDSLSNKGDSVNVNCAESSDSTTVVTDTLSHLANCTDSVLVCLKDISTYGIGYSDVISQIALPLLTMLFAFAFPFVFTAINHVNQKYDSKCISGFFESTVSYKLFWKSTWLSIVIVLIFGACSLLLSHDADWYGKCNEFGSYILFVTASIYSICIIVFIKTCIRFNKANGVLDAIMKQYARDKRTRKIKLCLNAISDFWNKHNPGTDKSYKDFNNFGIRSDRNRVNATPESLLSLRLTAITCYAIKKNDLPLFTSAMYLIDCVTEWENNKRQGKKNEIIKEGTNHHYTLDFLENVIDCYASSEDDSNIEESIVWKIVGLYDKTCYPNHIDTFVQTQILIKLVSAKAYSLIEKYIEKAPYAFSYINKLPATAYIKGGSADDILMVSTKSDKQWDEICNYHYAVWAFSLYHGCYPIIRYLLNGFRYHDRNLFPLSATSILRRHNSCKSNIHEDGVGYFYHTRVNELFGTQINLSDYVDRLTVALLLCTSTEDSYIPLNVTEKEIGSIQKEIDALIKTERILKNDNDFTKLYPNVAEQSVEEISDNAIELLKRSIGIRLVERHENREPKCLFDVIKSFFENKEIKETKKVEERIDLAGIDAVSGAEAYINETFSNFDDNIKHRVPQNIYNAHEANGNETMSLGTYHYDDSKWYFLNKESTDGAMRAWHFNVDEIYAAKATNLLLKALGEMSVKQEKLKVPKFHKYYLSKTGGKNSDYAIIDIGGHLTALFIMEFDRKYDEYYGSPYFDVDRLSYSLISDLPAVKRFKDSLLIVKASDLPVLVNEDGHSSPTVSLQDLSKEDKTNLNVRTKVDFHKLLKYSKDCEITQVTFTRG